ncbi:hypothetical protein BSLG_008813 [Batrachochytrium salamandrivorans]|nr:hypothetical protein BASA83_004667 [Batrachochytrium salamandrivorans]KAJ1332511.1 hypothetical protein BSLG_008813 [Batrachochytrium salamandrivorans]
MLEASFLFLLGLVLGVLLLPLVYVIRRWSLRLLVDANDYLPVVSTATDTPVTVATDLTATLTRSTSHTSSNFSNHSKTICDSCHPSTTGRLTPLHERVSDQCAECSCIHHPFNPRAAEVTPKRRSRGKLPQSPLDLNLHPQQPPFEDHIVAAFRQCVYSVLHFQAFNPETLPTNPASWPALFATPSFESLVTQVKIQSQSQATSLLSPPRTPPHIVNQKHPTGATDTRLSASGSSSLHPSAGSGSLGLLPEQPTLPTASDTTLNRSAGVLKIVPGNQNLKKPSISPPEKLGRRISTILFEGIAGIAAKPPTAEHISPKPSTLSEVALSPPYSGVVRNSRRSLANDYGSAISTPRAYARSHRFKPFDPGRVTVSRSTQHRPYTGNRHAIDCLKRHHYGADSMYEWFIPNFGQVKFTDHSPVAFAAVRDFFGYSLADLEVDLVAPLSMSTSTGKSDAVFLRSKSGRFLFKSLRGAEPENLKAFLPSYIPFILDNPDTLLPRYLGMFTLESPSRRSSSTSFASAATHSTASSERSGSSLHSVLVSHLPSTLQGRCTFVLMPNVFDTPLPIDFKYDFKGSTVGRQALRREELLNLFKNDEQTHNPSSGQYTGPGTSNFNAKLGELLIKKNIRSKEITFKELDFSRLLGEGIVNLIHLGPERREWLVKRLTKDTAILKKHEFMDYSLLIGVHVHSNEILSPTCVGSMDNPPLSYSEAALSIVSPQSAFPLTGSSFNRSHNARTIGKSSGSQPYISALQAISNLVTGSSSECASLVTSPAEYTSIMVDDPEEECVHFPTSETEPLLGSFRKRSRLENETQTPSEFKGGMRSVRQDEIYYFGLIDALQKYNYFKWMERNVKKQTSQIIHGPTALSSMFSGSSSPASGNSRGPPLNVMATPPLSPLAFNPSLQLNSTLLQKERLYRSPTHSRSRSATTISRTVSPQTTRTGNSDVSGAKTPTLLPARCTDVFTSPVSISSLDGPVDLPHPEAPDESSAPADSNIRRSLHIVPEHSESDMSSTCTFTFQSQESRSVSSNPDIVIDAVPDPPQPPPNTNHRHITFPTASLSVLPENSVEEPGRYASRLVDFVSGIVI